MRHSLLFLALLAFAPMIAWADSSAIMPSNVTYQKLDAQHADTAEQGDSAISATRADHAGTVNFADEIGDSNPKGGYKEVLSGTFCSNCTIGGPGVHGVCTTPVPCQGLTLF